MIGSFLGWLAHQDRGAAPADGVTPVSPRSLLRLVGPQPVAADLALVAALAGAVDAPGVSGEHPAGAVRVGLSGLAGLDVLGGAAVAACEVAGDCGPLGDGDRLGGPDRLVAACAAPDGVAVGALRGDEELAGLGAGALQVHGRLPVCLPGIVRAGAAPPADARTGVSPCRYVSVVRSLFAVRSRVLSDRLRLPYHASRPIGPPPFCDRVGSGLPFSWGGSVPCLRRLREP